MNTLNLIIILICINIIINVILFVILSYNFGYMKKAIHVFDRAIAKTLEYTFTNTKFNAKFDKAFFDENKFKEGDIAFIEIITKVDNNDKNEIKDKTDKSNKRL